MKIKCQICNNKNFKRLILINEVSRYTKKKYPLFKCKKCGFVKPFPAPYKNENKLKIYDAEENIRFYNKTNKKIDKNLKEYKYYFKHFKPYIQIIKKYKIKGKALDVGCGAGHLLTLMSKEGLRVHGLEITEKLAKALQNDFKIYCCEIGDKKLSKNKYDLITSNHVLEHIEDIDNFIKNLNKLLNNNGHALLAVPYISGLIPNILRSKWYGLGYGQHLNFFSNESLRILFEKNGFEILEFKILSVDYAHPNFPEVVNSIANFITDIIVSMGLGDNLFIVVRKIKDMKK